MRSVPLVAVALLSASGLAVGQDPSKQDYEKLRQRVEVLEKQLADLQKQSADQEDSEELRKEIKLLKDKMSAVQPGSTKLLITGYSFAEFDNVEHEDSTFSAGINPILLWKMGDRLFVEAELEIGLEDKETKVHLEYTQLSYVLNDYVTISAGRFLAPFGTFVERLHPKWINKLPNKPMAFDDGGISPEALLGVQVRGGLGLDGMKFNYAFYVANSPRLETADPTDAGKLFDDNFQDPKYGKTVGGRLGFLPIPELEIGYSLLIGKVGSSGTPFSDVNAVLQAADVSYVRDSDLLKGTINLLGQWAWSRVDTATYDPDGSLGFGPVTFENKRHGGYVQLSYRPSKVKQDIVSRFEIVGRYDALLKPRKAPDNIDEKRWTVGLDYWLSPSAVVKVAYSLDGKDDPLRKAQDENTFFVQFAIGF